MSSDAPNDKFQITRESLKKSGLLEQYVLGLTSREQNKMVEAFLEENPESKQDVDALREQLSSYVDEHDLIAPKDGRISRTADDFADLDHEMILEMMERNHSLSIWRYALGAACLLLLGLSGYLFRLNENHKFDLLEERARHAQDDTSHELRVKKLESSLIDWSALQTVTTYVGAGTIQLHYFPGDDQMILDLSHLELPKDSGDLLYYVYVGSGDDRKLALKILPANGHHLHALQVGGNQIQVYLEEQEGAKEERNLVAEITLP